MLRDEADFERHVEYIYYNPVKHGYVALPLEWPYSSFRRYVETGIYETGWGRGRWILRMSGMNERDVGLRWANPTYRALTSLLGWSSSSWVESKRNIMNNGGIFGRDAFVRVEATRGDSSRAETVV